MGKLNEINKRYAMIQEQRNYLSSTDYHVLKQMEGNYTTPQYVLSQRAEARENINALQSEIEELNLQDEEDTVSEQSSVYAEETP